MKSTELQPMEYALYYKPYLEALGDVDLLSELQFSLKSFLDFLKSIPEEKYEYRYAEGKWTIKDIIQHVIDAERIFAYRALRIARNDSTPLPGFDENKYVSTAQANSRSLAELLEEFELVRKTTSLLFKTFTQEQLTQLGIASEKSVSVRAIGFICIGHQKHHEKIIRERYLN
ncbi:DinB family protein [Flavobacterium sp.]|uniref:DinB family protein n=1 Tax=Flavobacterium sp. TaxID=239 RepID=UPI002FD94586